MRRTLAVLWMLCPLTSANAQVSIGIGMPNVSISINVPVYPQLVRIPGYPVYYAPGVESNYFFYDGMYWLCQGDNWYASSWYNGPWALVDPDSVPLYVLRVPVRYYRHPPAYFHGWDADAPPRWGEHWGASWERQHGGWDKWNRQAAPQPAPLPVYQKQYSGSRYPNAAEQRTVHGQNYHYQPHDVAVKQAYQAQGLHDRAAPSQPVSRGGQPANGAPHHDVQSASPSTGHAATPTMHAQPARVPEHSEGQRGKGADVQRAGPPTGHAATPAVHAQAARGPEHNEGQPGKGAPERNGNAGEEHGGNTSSRTACRQGHRSRRG